MAYSAYMKYYYAIVSKMIIFIHFFVMDKIELEITGISYSYSQSGAYTLILSESVGKRRLPIIIGQFEAQAIAIEMEKMKPARPLTHDLFRHLARNLNAKLNEVIINRFSEGVFYSVLIFEKDNNIFELDSRTSDAVALALRFNCPIYTYENVLHAAGIIYDESYNEVESDQDQDELLDLFDDDLDEDSDLAALSDDELQVLLNQAVENEDYEKASEIRDEITRRLNQ